MQYQSEKNIGIQPLLEYTICLLLYILRPIPPLPTAPIRVFFKAI